MRLVFDIEGDNLYNKITKVHCIRAYDLDTSTMYRFDKDHEPIFRGIKLLNEAEELIGHNIVGFDIPALHKLFPDFNWKNRKVFDTIIMSKFVFTDLEKTDLGRITAGKLPKDMYQKHSLEAWGHRLGEHKGEYGKKFKDESAEEYQQRVWANYNKEMASYCEQDVLVNVKLYRYIMKKVEELEVPQRAIDIEHKFATIISRQERHGVKFDIDKAIKLEHELRIKATEALNLCKEVYKPKWFIKKPPKGKGIECEIDGEKFIYQESKVNRKETCTFPTKDGGEIEIKTTGKIKGAKYTNIELIEFNPNSGNHIIKWLTEEFNWSPAEFTKKGNPKTDGDTLASLTFDGIKPLQDYQLLTKRLSMIADGDGSLINKCDKETGRLFGRCDTLGAVTRRCTHSSPNLAQIPAGSKDKEGNYLWGMDAGKKAYGNEFRELFTVPKGYKLVGADASGLELRTLAHYLTLFDNGAYADIVLNGDIHSKNQEDAGLPTRNDAKTFIYAFLYGAGEEKLGEIVAPNDPPHIKKAKGKALKKKFMASNPAIKKLTDAVKKRAGARGYVYDLDQKKLFIRSTHSALNMVLQSCGAILMKYWLVEVDEELQERGYEHSDDVLHTDREHDYEFVLNVHDEAQTEVKAELADEVAEVKAETFSYVGKQVKMNIQIDGEADVGDSWKETH